VEIFSSSGKMQCESAAKRSALASTPCHSLYRRNLTRNYAPTLVHK